ncbi:DNA-binding protein [Stenotrophomonas maltophilia]|uniref:DNA-binding protein n=1 Tax=Stenotrophomonas maltophilia TaxID=40324 RepID=UPI003BA37A69
MAATRRTTRQKLRTPEEARQWLRDNGITVIAFAKEHNLSRHALNDAFRGIGKGTYGKSRAAAIALGIVHAPNSCTKPSKPARKPAAKSAAGKKA